MEGVVLTPPPKEIIQEEMPNQIASNNPEYVRKVSDLFNFGQAELRGGYAHSMRCYQSESTFAYLL